MDDDLKELELFIEKVRAGQTESEPDKENTPLTESEFNNLYYETVPFELSCIFDDISYGDKITPKLLKKTKDSLGSQRSLREAAALAREVIADKTGIEISDAEFFENKPDRNMLDSRIGKKIADVINERGGTILELKYAIYSIEIMTEMRKRERLKCALSLDVSESGDYYETFVHSPQDIVKTLLPFDLCGLTVLHKYLCALTPFFFGVSPLKFFEHNPKKGFRMNSAYLYHMITRRTNYYKAHGIDSEDALRKHIAELGKTDELLRSVPGLSETYEKIINREVEYMDVSALDYVTETVWNDVANFKNKALGW